MYAYYFCEYQGYYIWKILYTPNYSFRDYVYLSTLQKNLLNYIRDTTPTPTVQKNASSSNTDVTDDDVSYQYIASKNTINLQAC